jgi:hypothetical protein
MGGYSHEAYAAALAETGDPYRLIRAHGTLLVRRIHDSADRDAMAPYPLLCCGDWDQLPADLDELDGHVVSVTAVTDPLGEQDADRLRRAFTDLVEPYKEHHIVDLPAHGLGHISSHHRRNATRALRRLEVVRLDPPWRALDTWCALYSTLVERHDITGNARFSRASFSRQLRVPGMVAYIARRDGEPLAMALWVVDGQRGYYHLGASSPAGYAERASYALFWTAIEELGEEVDALDLGAGAGARGNEEDGLTRFKRGWSTRRALSHLGGRICDRERYRSLVEALPATRREPWFPAYRAGEFA